MRDRYRYELTTGSPEAARCYGEAVDLNLGGTLGADEALEDAVAADPDFALARIARARAYQFAGRIPEAQAEKEAALARSGSATRRETQHVLCVARAIEGDGPGALELLREHIAEFPRDAFVLSQATGPFGLLGFGGGPDWRAELFALLEPLATAYGADWWFDQAFAFTHNELGNFSEARRLAERSLAAHPRSGHGSHTMAHVDFETGRFEGGAEFLRGWLPGYERRAALFTHLVWHLALFEINSGCPEAVLPLWQETIRPQVSPGTPIIALADAASLMWRCDLYGLDRPAGSREDVRDFAAKAFPNPGVTFADVHAGLAYAAAGDWPAFDRLRSGVRERLGQGKLAAGEVVVVVLDAIEDFAAGRFAEAAARLGAWTDQIVRIGGSNAQRQVIEDTLLEAYLRSGQVEKASALLAERLRRRPSARDAGMLTKMAV